MALIQMNLMSSALMRTVNVTVILPTDKLLAPGAARREGPCQTLYLLHGLLGSEYDWVTGTPIRRWAEERDLAVVMPAGENSHYVDRTDARADFGAFVGSELVELTREIFPLSRRREDTFVAGLSMGGYGALRNGLKYSERFGAIGAFSVPDPLETVKRLRAESGRLTESRRFFESCFGPAERLAGSDKDLLALAETLCREKRALPRLFLACGDGDPLLPGNRRLAAALRALGFSARYEESEGGHDWDFWTAALRSLLDWLPLRTNAGIHSGNVFSEEKPRPPCESNDTPTEPQQQKPE